MLKYLYVMYNQIAKDSYIQDIYNKISHLEDNQIFYCNHSQSHINNVVKTVGDILTCLSYSQEIIEDAKIACKIVSPILRGIFKNGKSK